MKLCRDNGCQIGTLKFRQRKCLHRYFRVERHLIVWAHLRGRRRFIAGVMLECSIATTSGRDYSVSGTWNVLLFGAKLTSCTTRFFCKKLKERMFVCSLVDRPCVTLPEILSLQKYISKRFYFRFTRYCEVIKLPTPSLSPLLQRRFFSPSPQPCTVKARRPLRELRREVQS